MPDDIVQRLRNLDGTYAITTILDCANEAADEIVRLRAGWLDQAARDAAEIVRLEVEIERLLKLVAKRELVIARMRTRRTEAETDVGGFRPTDPDTSVDAAYSLNIDHLKYAILSVLRDSSTPLNCSEIGDRMETVRDTVTPRMPSLRAAQLVEAVGLRPGPSRRDQTSYVLTPRGRQAVTQRAIE